MKLTIRLFLIFFFFTFSFVSSAQTCQDTLRYADPNYAACSVPYYPVCGCDGNTYRDKCAAYYKGGLNDWSDGSCGDFDYCIDPTIVEYYLNLQMFMKYAGTVSVRIYDAFGHIVYSSQFFVPQTNQETYSIKIYEVSDLEFGYYIIGVSLNGEQISKKFFNTSN